MLISHFCLSSSIKYLFLFLNVHLLIIHILEVYGKKLYYVNVCLYLWFLLFL